MIRVKDQSGNIIPGLFKTGMGALVVKNDSEYDKYIQTKQQQEVINNLTQEVSELKTMVQNLISLTTRNEIEGK